jgi:hypothetical protein
VHGAQALALPHAPPSQDEEVYHASSYSDGTQGALGSSRGADQAQPLPHVAVRASEPLPQGTERGLNDESTCQRLNCHLNFKPVAQEHSISAWNHWVTTRYAACVARE